MLKTTQITRVFLVALSVYMLGDAFLWSGFNSIVYPTKVEQAVSKEQLSLLTGAAAFTGVMIGTSTCVLTGAFSDRARFRMGRRRPFMIVGAVAVAASLTLLTFASEFIHLLAGYIILQISANVAIAGYFGLLPDLVPTEKTGLASGIINLFQFIGSLLGFVGAGYLVGVGNIQMAIALQSAIILAMMVITVLRVKEEPFLDSGTVSVGGVFSSFSKVPKDLLLLTSSRFFALTGSNVLTFFSLFYVSDVLGAEDPALLVAALGAAVLLVAMFSGALSGFFSDKVGRKGLAVVACVFGSVGMVMLAFVSSVAGLIAAGCMLGACMGIFMTTTWALSSDLSPVGLGGTTMSLSNFATGASTAVAPGYAGIVLYLTQDLSWSSRGYKPLFLSSAVFFLVGIALILKVKEKVRQPTQRGALAAAP